MIEMPCFGSYRNKTAMFWTLALMYCHILLCFLIYHGNTMFWTITWLRCLLVFVRIFWHLPWWHHFLDLIMKVMQCVFDIYSVNNMLWIISWLKCHVFFIICLFIYFNLPCFEPYHDWNAVQLFVIYHDNTMFWTLL